MDATRCRRFVELLLTPKPAAVPLRPGREATAAEAHRAGREQELLDACARAITRSAQTRILRDDLPALAEAIRSEGTDCPATSQAWLASYDASSQAAAGHLPTEELWTLWARAEEIGRQQLTGEVGSDTFARTVAHTATVAASTVGAPEKPKSVATVLSALRGYTLAVWAMVSLLTRRGHFGPRVVELAVAAGGVLLVAAIFVPAMPLGFTLAGVMLLLAGVSAGGLLPQEARGVGWRLGICALLAAAALGGYLYWEWRRGQLSQSVWSVLVKVGIGLLVVLLGWFIARAHPRGSRADRVVGGRAGRTAGEDAGREAGRRVGGDAGAEVGRRAGRVAGATAGRLAGEQAGQRVRRANRLLKYGSAGNPTRRTDVRAAVREAGRLAGSRAGERAGRKAAAPPAAGQPPRR